MVDSSTPTSLLTEAQVSPHASLSKTSDLFYKLSTFLSRLAASIFPYSPRLGAMG
jgi:hypothetical protein